MWELIKKSMLAGIGLASMGKEKAEELIEQMRKQADVPEEEGKKLLDELMDASQEARKDLQEKILDLVKEALVKLDVPTREDWSKLAARIEKLEKEKESGEK